MKRYLAIIASLPSVVLANPQFGLDGSIKSPSSAYSINGSTGLATFGSLSLTTSQPAHSVFVTPSDGPGVPTFRGLTAADIPTLNQNTTGTASNVTGTIAVANGGTGTASASANAFFSGPITATGTPSFRAMVPTDVAAALGATPNGASDGYGWTWPQYQFFGSGKLTNNWLTTYAYGAAGTPAVGLNTSQGFGLTGAGRTSTCTISNCNVIGIGGFGFADGNTGTTSTGSAWGGYFECRNYTGSTGYCAGVEIDSTNLSSTPQTNPVPYAALPTTNNIGLHIAAGGACITSAKCYDPANGTADLAASQSAAAIVIGTNNTNFITGLLFQCGAVGSTTCSNTGAGDIIRTYPGTYLNWYNSAAASIFNFGVDPGVGLVGALRWTSSGLAVENLTTAQLILDPSTGDFSLAGHIRNLSGAPTLSSCGSGGSVTAGSNNSAGIVALGTSVTSCVVTFATAYPGKDFCTVIPTSTNYGGTYWLSGLAAGTGFTLNISSAVAYNQTFSYTCMGN